MVMVAFALLASGVSFEYVKSLSVPYSLEIWPGPNGSFFTSGIEDRKDYLMQWDKKGSCLRKYEIPSGYRYAGLDNMGVVCMSPELPIKQSSEQLRANSPYISRYLYLDGTLLIERGSKFTVVETMAGTTTDSVSLIREVKDSIFSLGRDRKEIAFISNTKQGARVNRYTLAGKRMNGGLLKLTSSEWKEPFFHSLCINSLKDGSLVGMAYVTRKTPKRDSGENKAFIVLVNLDMRTIMLLKEYPISDAGKEVDYAFDPDQRVMAILEDQHLAILRTTTAIELYKWK